MADLYRKSALERISSPEQLDKVLKVTSPMSWLALLGITLIVAVTVVWSIVGSIPMVISTKGIISSPVGSNAVYIQEAGTVVSVRVRTGDEIHHGDPVLTYRNASNEVLSVYSNQAGTVAGLVANLDDVLNPGSEIIRVTPNVPSSQMVVCYVPLAQAKKLERGMRVNVLLDSLDSTSYGNMVARVINITSSAALPLDWLIGTTATALAAIAMYHLRNVKVKKLPVLSLLMPAVMNGILVGAELTIYIKASSMWLNAFFVALGEIGVLFTLGVGLYFALLPVQDRIFKES